MRLIIRVNESKWKVKDNILAVFLAVEVGEMDGNKVVGESRKKEEYLCFADHYCACYSFFYDVVNRGEQLCCKHQLAARLPESLGSCVEVKLPDEELTMLLSSL